MCVCSASEEQRDIERDRLERGAADTSRRIDKLVTEHQPVLVDCLQSFRQVSQRVTGGGC
jgi:hypothetical protein